MISTDILDENVLIVASKFTETSPKYVRFATTLTYENKGHSRYSDVVRKEYARIEVINENISGEKYDYT